jgi:hypothetical protein
MLLTLAGAGACTVAFGDDKPAAAEARAAHERELAVCLREANAAYAQAERGGD